MRVVGLWAVGLWAVGKVRHGCEPNPDAHRRRISLADWVDPWTGDPARGTLQMTWTAEEGSPVETAQIIACDRPAHAG